MQGINQYLFGWLWLVVPLVKSDGKILWLSISLKRTNLFFFFFLHGDIHQGKVASETTTFGWVWLGVPLFQLDCVILDHECHCKESIHVNQLTSEATTFGGT